MITLDSLRADHCSFMGYERKTTPTIDKMAKDGLYFENAISAGGGTPASMFSTFTGYYSPVAPREIRAGPWRKALSKKKTLARELSKHGYSTGAFNPNAFASSFFGFDKGFNYFQDFLGSDNRFLTSLYNKVLRNVTNSGMKGLASNLRNLRNFVQREEIFKPWESYYNFVVDWTEKAEKPFFLWILSLDTHHPYLSSREYRKWSNLFTMWQSNWKLQKVNWEDKLSDKERKWLINAYDDSIYYADRFIEKLWNNLKDLDPIFIIHSDHGEGFGEHGFYGHQPYLYEEIIHVPLVIYNAGIRGRIEKPVSLLGLPATILDLINEENKFLSNSFLKGGNDLTISKVFENDKRKVAVRMKDWKFITGQKNKDTLYNLKKDLHEQENVVREYPRLVEEMKKIVKSHIKQETSEKVKK